MTRPRKLAATIVLFAVAVVIVIVAGTVHDVGPLFLVWIPLLAVPWLLTRREPGDPLPSPEQMVTPESAADEASRGQKPTES